MNQLKKRPLVIWLFSVVMILLGSAIILSILFPFLQALFAALRTGNWPTFARVAFSRNMMLTHVAMLPWFICLLGGSVGLFLGRKYGWYLTVGLGLGGQFFGTVLWPFTVPSGNSEGSPWFEMFLILLIPIVLAAILSKRSAREYCGLYPFPIAYGVSLSVLLGLANALTGVWAFAEITRHL